MSKMLHIFYKNYLLSNASWHTADIPEDSEIKLNCEVQSKWNLYLQLIGLTLIVSKTGTSCQGSKEIGRGKKKSFTLVLCKNMFLSLLQKKKNCSQL